LIPLADILIATSLQTDITTLYHFDPPESYGKSRADAGLIFWKIVVDGFFITSSQYVCLDA